MLATKPIPEGIPKVASPPQQTTGVATSSHLTNTKEEEVVEVSDSEDEFEVFNQALYPETLTPDLGHPSFDLGHPFTLIIDKMGIQRKPRFNLLDLIKSQPGMDALRKATLTKPPTPPHVPCPSDLNLST